MPEANYPKQVSEWMETIAKTVSSDPKLCLEHIALLESLVFAKRAARHIAGNYQPAAAHPDVVIDPSAYDGYREKYKELVLEAIEKERQNHE